MSESIQADIRVGLIISVFNVPHQIFDLVEKEITERPVGMYRELLNEAMLFNAHDRLLELTENPSPNDDEALNYFLEISTNYLTFAEGKDYLGFMMEVKANAEAYRKELHDLGFKDGS